VVHFKDMVRLRTLTPAIMAIFVALIQLDSELDGDITVTSINDSRHMANSQHYRNTAVDIRCNDRPQHVDRLMVGRLSQLLGPSYTVLHESAGTPNEHIHLQIKKSVVLDD
jgi:hypothetical protein